MPLYAYQPQRSAVTSQNQDAPCGGPCCTFETLQSLGESPLSACPHCGHPIERAITAPSHSIVGRGGAPQSGMARAEKKQGIFGATEASDSAGKRVARLSGSHVCSLYCRH